MAARYNHSKGFASLGTTMVEPGIIIAVVFLNLDVSVLRKHVNVVQTVNVAIIAHVEAIAVAVKLFINLHFF